MARTTRLIAALLVFVAAGPYLCASQRLSPVAAAFEPPAWVQRLLCVAPVAARA